MTTQLFCSFLSSQEKQQFYKAESTFSWHHTTSVKLLQVWNRTEL